MKQLPPGTVRLLTSAQVITSVYSAVKELVENALDAQATSIAVKLENFGLDRIEVKDNGTGINPEDTPYMALPHYTSKISDESDLETLRTYGFRGEALGSLCAVSEVVIATRTSTQEHGMSYCLDSNGSVTESKPAPMAVGTAVAARQLFKAVPVRRQALRSSRRCQEALRQVEHLLLTYSVMCTSVRLSLTVNHKLVWQRAAGGDSRSALLAVWGSEVMGHMVRLKHTHPDSQVELQAYVPKLGSPRDVTSRTSSDRCFVFVNSRPVSLRDIEKTLRRCYNDSVGCEASRWPLAFIHFTVPPRQLDVNLEPNKNRVFIHNMDDIMTWFTSLLEDLYQPKQAVQNSAKPTPPDLSITQRMSDAAPVINIPASFDNTDVVVYEGNASMLSGPADLESSLSSLSGDQTLHIKDLSATVAESEQNEISSEKVRCSSGEGRTGASCVMHPDKSLSGKISSGDPVDPSGAVDLFGGGEGDDELLKLCLDVTPVMTSTQNCQAKILSASDDAASWSKGHAVCDDKGQSVQPARLLVPNRCADTPTMTLSSFSTSKTPQSTRSLTMTTPTNLDTSQTTLYKMVGRSALKSASPAFLHYSSSTRHQVCKEFPHANPDQVNELVTARWQVLTSHEKSQYNPPTPTSPQTRALSPANRTSTLLRKRKLSDENQNSIIDILKSVKKSKKIAKSCVPLRESLVIPFNMSTVQKHWQGESISNNCSAWETYLSKPNSLSPIGSMKSRGLWACLLDHHIIVFQSIKAQQELVYRRLSTSHILPTELLDNPIPLNPGMVGGLSAWNTLQGLAQSSESPQDPNHYVTDPRITSNGFKVCHRPNHGRDGHQTLVVAMATSIVTIKDLQEILYRICGNLQTPVSDSRPLKVTEFLKSQAVRMSHRLPEHVHHSDVIDVWKKANDSVKPTLGSADQPSYTWDLGSLNSLLPSQAFSQNTQSNVSQIVM